MKMPFAAHGVWRQSAQQGGEASPLRRGEQPVNAAKPLGIGKPTLFAILAREEIKAPRLGSRTLISAIEFSRYVETVMWVRSAVMSVKVAMLEAIARPDQPDDRRRVARQRPQANYPLFPIGQIEMMAEGKVPAANTLCLQDIDFVEFTFRPSSNPARRSAGVL
ncbi:MAG: hypothetical protein WCJ41_21080 [Aestuariivirga sp.]|uniref:hypothetical protein n=1 Tax=Aestuariivirga sp. TaxID=2650926 RepID=UPI00301ADA2C